MKYHAKNVIEHEPWRLLNVAAAFCFLILKLVASYKIFFSLNSTVAVSSPLRFINQEYCFLSDTLIHFLKLCLFPLVKNQPPWRSNCSPKLWHWNKHQPFFFHFIVFIVCVHIFFVCAICKLTSHSSPLFSWTYSNMALKQASTTFFSPLWYHIGDGIGTHKLFLQNFFFNITPLLIAGVWMIFRRTGGHPLILCVHLKTSVFSPF